MDIGLLPVARPATRLALASLGTAAAEHGTSLELESDSRCLLVRLSVICRLDWI